MEVLGKLDCHRHKELAMVFPTLEEVLKVRVSPILMPLSAILQLNKIPYYKIFHKSTHTFTTKKSVLWAISSCLSHTTITFPPTIPWC